ncbi:unnamed protein product [Cuscuta epithymum]|uniref:endo-polygalacturonase n=1 Tax=Cuscuta epithymum TaxID=186058 RepID=A0AAV0G7R8_9ASTE|nr:unnamed protein product [Cuscuta epithymum]
MMRRCNSSSPKPIFHVLFWFVYSAYVLPTIEKVNGESNKPRSTFALNVLDFGAAGDGIADDTNAFKHVWWVACTSQSRANVIVPEGQFIVTPINFTGPCMSRVSLKVFGSIVAPEDPEVWNGLDRNKWLYFMNVKHLTIKGRGMINGKGQRWWDESCKINKSNPCRHAPKAMTFHKCNYLRIRGLLMVNSQQMHLSLTSCVNVTVSRLRILAPSHSPNTDGIHISTSSRVTIKDCIIGTGDDCISIVGNSSWIRIRGITCGPGHGISIGSLGKSSSWDNVHDVSVIGAFFSNTKNGARIKTWQGGGGFARKISYENIMMKNVSNPIIIDQYYCDSSKPCLNKTSAVGISNVAFMRIKGTSATMEAIRIACSDTSPCRKIFFKDVDLISSSGGTSFYCWNAYGSTENLVYPTPCFPCATSMVQPTIIQHTSSSSSSILSM